MIPCKEIYASIPWCTSTGYSEGVHSAREVAEWMREHKPTATHLTPAMGQILVSGAATKFPPLGRLILVGDVTTRDCRSPQELTVNAN